MTTLYSLLSLPKTSDGFTASIPTSLVDSSLDGSSESPPHKVPRLNSDNDSASAARSRQAHVEASLKRQGPVEIEIIGDYSSFLTVQSNAVFVTGISSEPQPPAGQRQIELLSHCIRILLGRTRIDVLPATYEGIYNSCRWVVNSRLGLNLYQNLCTELERCIEDIARDMCISVKNDLMWIASFNEELDWFEKQLVSE